MYLCMNITPPWKHPRPNLLISRQTSSRSLANFPTLDALITPIRQCRIELYGNTVINPHAEFPHHFTDFAKTETDLELVSCPLSFDSDKSPPDTRPELVNIRCDSASKENCKTGTTDQSYASLDEKRFPNMSKLMPYCLKLVDQQKLNNWDSKR